MATGTLSGGICFYSQAAAARNECSLSIRNSTTLGYSCQFVLNNPSEVAGGAYLMSYTQRFQTGPSTNTSSTMTTQLQSCATEDYWPMSLSIEDGLIVSGAVAGVWCLAWALRAVRSALDSAGADS